MTFVWDICILMMIYGFALLVFDFMTPVAAVVAIFDNVTLIASKYNLILLDVRNNFMLVVYFIIKHYSFQVRNSVIKNKSTNSKILKACANIAFVGIKHNVSDKDTKH